MLKMQPNVSAWMVATAIALAVQTLLAVDVKVEHDKAFNFKEVRTWGWKPDGPGKVIMARTADDDPEAMQKRVEPIVMSEIDAQMTQRGLKAATGAPDVFVTYFLLLSTVGSAQTIGQFIPGSAVWGLPPFLASTQSLEMMNQGSLVIDLSAKNEVVWRGLAQADIKIGIDAKKRESLLREGVRDLLKRYPPKS
ncbi:MAG TPA: DUF4136 domain-containing protein [Hyphomonadaceae bacterium]|nr:DUF4136 domain-containing protein [Hyphomonadaceae bacterium]